jgi:hypothetical protein
MIEEEKRKCCCSSVLDWSDDFWQDYKKHSGKFAIALSVLGGISSILIGIKLIPASIALAITNSATFFSGVCYEKLKSENKLLETDNQSLRRQTTFVNNFKFPASESSTILETPKSTTSTQYETVKPFKNSNEPI